MNKLESVVIVRNKFGSVATIRFEGGKGDKIISATSRNTIYKLVEKHIAGVLDGTVK